MIIITSFLLIYSMFCYGIENKRELNRDSIQLEQRQRLYSAEQQRKNLKKSQFIDIEDKVLKTKVEKRCFTVKSIDVKGITVFSDKQKNKLIETHIERCLSINDINDLIKIISNYYIREGYITTQVNVPEQDLTQGELIILINEGLIELIEIQDSPIRTIKMIYPKLIGKVLNLRDIEQGLEQLNRLNSHHYSIDIRAGSTTGLSHIFIYREGKSLPLTAKLQLDNSGSKSTGDKQLNLTLTIDSLLGLGEQWSLTGNSDTDFSQSYYNRHYMLSLNIPYGYWNYHYHLLNSRSLQNEKINGQSFHSIVKNSNQWFEISRLIYRDAKQRILLQGGIENKRIETQLSGQIIEISSPILTSLHFTAQYSKAIGKGYFTFNPTFKHGIAAFGASPDIAIGNYPRSHFSKFSLNTSYQYLANSQLSYLTTFYGQTTPNNLYGIEQIHISGHYSVRGFKAKALSGNQGFYWRNEINYQLMKPEIGSLMLIGAWDFGYLAAENEAKQNRLSGTALGIHFNHKSGISSQFMVSKPLYYPKNLKPDNWSLYWSVSLSL